MSWNYRVVMEVDPLQDEVTYSISEVYYDETGEVGWHSQCTPMSTSNDDIPGVEGIRANLDQMREALNRPVLVADEEGVLSEAAVA
jgi:hypothetical protein